MKVASLDFKFMNMCCADMVDSICMLLAKMIHCEMRSELLLNSKLLAMFKII
jgi:hypothetical protein